MQFWGEKKEKKKKDCHTSRTSDIWRKTKQHCTVNKTWSRIIQYISLQKLTPVKCDKLTLYTNGLPKRQHHDITIYNFSNTTLQDFLSHTFFGSY